MNPGEPGHEEARRLLEECCHRCRCVYSSVHLAEIPEPYRVDILGYLSSIAEFSEVDLGILRVAARHIIEDRGLSPSRELDLMHLEAARALGCRYLLARDRFLWRYANSFGLVYVNWETHGGECPCSPRESGGASGTRQASCNTLSPRSRKPGQPGSEKPSRPTSAGSKAKQATRRLKDVSRSSSKRSKRRGGSPHGGPRRRSGG